MLTAAVERDERSNGVDRESVRSLTDTSSNTEAVSQVSPNKLRGQRRRARRKSSTPRPPDVMPDPETGCVAVSCRRPTDTVLRVESVESCLGQSPARGVQKASAIRDAPQHESPVCVSGAGVIKVVVSPKIVRNLWWYIVPCRAIAIYSFPCSPYQRGWDCTALWVSPCVGVSLCVDVRLCRVSSCTWPVGDALVSRGLASVV